MIKTRVIGFLEERAEMFRGRIGWDDHHIRFVPANLVPANPTQKGWAYVWVSLWRLWAAWLESRWHPAIKGV